jgi:hypothetical protein
VATAEQEAIEKSMGEHAEKKALRIERQYGGGDVVSENK